MPEPRFFDATAFNAQLAAKVIGVALGLPQAKVIGVALGSPEAES